MFNDHDPNYRVESTPSVVSFVGGIELFKGGIIHSAEKSGTAWLNKIPQSDISAITTLSGTH